MSSSVSERIANRNAGGRGALIGYLPVGYPELATGVDAAVTALKNGVDAIELGVPYSDPVMDGGAIQEAARQSLVKGFKVSDVFRAVEAIRARVDAPVLVMTYANPVEQYGVERFAQHLSEAGTCGMVTPDLTPDNALEWIDASTRYDLERVFLAAPSSTDERIARITEASNGFVYAASVMGVTGVRRHLSGDARRLVARIQAVHDGPVCVGIGVSTPDHVRGVLEYANGAIVGSALVGALAAEGVEGVARFARSLSTGTRPSS